MKVTMYETLLIDCWTYCTLFSQSSVSGKIVRSGSNHPMDSISDLLVDALWSDLRKFQ